MAARRLVLLVAFILMGVGCTNSQKKLPPLKPQDQAWDLPPDIKQFDEPPKYPDTGNTLLSTRPDPGSNNMQMGNSGRGGGGGMGGPGMGGH